MCDASRIYDYRWPAAIPTPLMFFMLGYKYDIGCYIADVVVIFSFVDNRLRENPMANEGPYLYS